MSSRDLAELRRRHSEIRVRMVQINDAHPDGSLGDDGAEWTRLDGEVGQIEGAITRQSRLDDLERRSAAVPADGGTGDAGFDRLLAQTTFADVVRAQMPGVSDAGAGRAIECSQELARRNGTKPEGLLFSLRCGTALSGMAERRVGQTSSVNALGAFLIEDEVQPPIDRLRERTIVRKLGATVLGGLQGDLQIPRLAGSSTTGWVGDGQALTPSNLTFDNIGLFVADAWESIIGDWLESGSRVTCTVAQVSAAALKLETARLSTQDQRRISPHSNASAGSEVNEPCMPDPGSGVPTRPTMAMTKTRPNL